MPEIEIRPVLQTDVEQLATLEHGYYSNYVWQMSLDLSCDVLKPEFHRVRLPRQVLVAYPRSRDEIFKDFGQAEAFLVALIGGMPVGYLKLLAETANRIARVSDLVVSTTYHRQGIASGLLLATLDLVSHRKFSALILEMQSKNDPAISLAGKLGFKFCGFRDHYFPNNDLALFFSRFTH